MARAPISDGIRPIVTAFLGGDPPLDIRCWDGSVLEGDGTLPGATLVIRSPRALRRLLWAPDELGLGRAYVAGEIDVEGDVYEALRLRDTMGDADEEVHVGLDRDGWMTVLRAALRLRVIGPPPRPPAGEARLRGRRHSKRRDAAAISHHYDVGNDFYRLVLGETMTYSCAYFPTATTGLDQAQEAKYELICRKLGLEPGQRLLDVGCGWGGMVLHAARHHDVEAVGITLSQEQAELARKRVAEAGLTDRIEIRIQDYRDVDDGPFDAISSIGMFEHVGMPRLKEYFTRLYGLLRPEGRLLNHAISRPDGDSTALHPRSFIARYVFPDGELHEVGRVVSAMQDLGFEVRDVESLREHYARTLRAWVENLEHEWDRAVSLAGLERARVWRLYMAASAINFEANRTAIHQVLGVRTAPDGRSGMPATRAGFASVEAGPLD